MPKELVINNKKLMQEWNWEKNNSLGLFPDKITCGTHKQVWWRCAKCSHEWATSVGHRTDDKKPTNCPKCSAYLRAKNRQDNLRKSSNVAILYPYILSEWDYEKNTVSPYKLTKGSHEIVWWKCKNGHEWKTSVGNRIKRHKCPYCTGRFAISGVNDLETINPELAKEWNYEKNGELKPSNVKCGSNKKVWWKCKYGHEWEATIVNRNKKRGCPICSQSRHISIPEKAIYYYLSKMFKIEQNVKIPDNNMELDLFIPQINLAIEYDGNVWHKDIKRDIIKDNYCFENNIHLVRIREYGTPEYNSTAKFIYTDKPDLELKYLKPVLHELFEYINKEFNVSITMPINIEKDYYEIISQIKKYDYENSLAYKFPELIKEWNYQKNGSLMPENISSGSSKKVWWKCKNGHEWKTAITNRTNESNRNLCPYCQRKKTIIGVNDIVTLNCEFLKDWDYDKNKLPPNQYMKNSGKKVWWKCHNCGYEWKTTIDSMSKHKYGCRLCSWKEIAKNRARKVINLDTNQVFNSAKDAAEYYGIRSGTINRVCCGERKTGGGYHWKYVYDKKDQE